MEGFPVDSISKLTHRRFVMGAQGLWPGRRWRGAKGVSAAIRTTGSLQLDPLNIVARSQHIALHGRVLDYQQDYLHKAAYKRREFFDYGGALFLYPMEELPYWRAIMERASRSPRMQKFRKEHPQAMAEVLEALRLNGPMANRDFEGNRLQAHHYRGRKDSAVALFYLWLLGEVMVTERRGFDRVYDLWDRVAPEKFHHTAPVDEAEDFFARKMVAEQNVMREKRFLVNLKYAISRPVEIREAQSKLDQLLEKGTLAPLHIEGSKETWLTLAENLPLLEVLEAARVPKAWKPLGPTTEQEVTLLAPLEIATARGRAKQLFDFEYIWEVYKPAHQRRWGYYTLPILYGDDLVARLDPRLDRSTNTLQILGFWLEEDGPQDEAFARALGKGIARFARMAGAQRVDLKGILPKKLRDAAKREIQI